MDELTLRVRDLESYISDHKSNLKIIKILAGIFGLAAFAAGGWLSYVSAEYSKLSSQYSSLAGLNSETERDLKTTQAQVDSLQSILDQGIEQLLLELRQRSSDIVAAAESDIANTVAAKKAELANLSADDILAPLQTGSAAINVRRVTISNGEGQRVIDLGTTAGDETPVVFVYDKNGNLSSKFVAADTGGFFVTFGADGSETTFLGSSSDADGMIRLRHSNGETALAASGDTGIRLFNQRGEKRFHQRMVNDQAVQTSYRDSDGEYLSFGGLKGSQEPYVFLKHSESGRSIVSIYGDDDSGGKVVLRTEDGETQLVYLGPTDNGNGIVRVDPRDSGKSASMAAN